MVIAWKHRDEGGWFRRTRLVGRQFGFVMYVVNVLCRLGIPKNHVFLQANALD